MEHQKLQIRLRRIIALDRFISNLKGEAKGRFESLLRDFGMAQDLLEEKGRLEREYASDIAALTSALEEEQEHRACLEERLESLDEINHEIVAKIIKDKELFIAKYKLMKKEKAEFVVANVRLQGEFEKLEKAHKALESEHSILVKSHENYKLRSLSLMLLVLLLLPVIIQTLLSRMLG